MKGVPSIGAEFLAENGHFNPNKVRYVPESFYNQVKRGIVKKGDVLIVKDGATTGKISFVDNYFSYDTAAVNEHVFRLRVDEQKCLQKFLFYYLFSKQGNAALMKNFKGTAQGGINSQFVNNLNITLPAISIQKAIVKKLDLFFGEYEILKEEKQKLKEGHEKILQSAIDKAVKNFNIGKGTIFSDVATVNGRIGWRGLKRSEYRQEGPMFLAVKNLGKYKLDFSNVNHISKERYDESPEIILNKCDVLLSKDGTIGRVGFVRELPSETTVNSSIVVIRPKNKNFLIPEFLYRYFQSLKFQSLVDRKKTGTCVPHLFQKDIKDFELSIPSIEEQKTFVKKIRYIEQSNKIIDESYVQIKKNIELLPNSVLKKAFKGELIS